MKSIFFDKIILKNKLFSLGRVCFAICALYQQADAGFGTETQIKERALILPWENSLKHLQSMLSEFKSEYNGYNGKSLTTTIDQELTTRNLCKSIYQIFMSLYKNKKESFLSYFKLFCYDDFLKNDKHNNVSESDKKAFEELISILDEKIKELSSKPANSKPSSKPVIPWLNVYEKPAQLTPGELMAGGNQTPVKLVKRTAINTYTKNEENCLQFVDKNDNPLKYKKKESNCYKTNDINDHLNLTKEVYKDAIEQIQKKAYRSIKTIINNNKINEKSIESILTNYLDISNNREEIDVTGASLSQEEQQDIKKYMELCTAVYSDIYTRNFLIEEAPESVVNKWNDIIKKHEEINSLFNTLEGLMKHYRE